MVSEFGKILDPVADKATEAVIAICLMKRYEILIYLLILFAIKETFMSVCGLIVIRKTGENNGAKWYGKVSTFAFYIVMITLLIIRHIPLSVANVMIIMCMFLWHLHLLCMQGYITRYLKEIGARQNSYKTLILKSKF